MKLSILPESLRSIGDRAFADAENLRCIYIPDAVGHIGQDVFAGAKHVTITASADSRAREWAHENGIPFTPMAEVCAHTESPQAADGTVGEESSGETALAAAVKTDSDDRPTGRTAGEVKASRYRGRAALNIQDRYVP